MQDATALTAFPGGLMRFPGRALLVCLVVCLGPMPARSEAALIDVVPTDFGTVDPGTYGLEGTFANDNDIALFAFSLSSPSTVIAELTSFLCADPANCVSTSRGFDPILTLLEGDEERGFAVSVTGNDPFTLELPLGPGDYLLAVTQFDNFYLGGGAFEHDDLVNFTEFFFDRDDLLECDAFIAIVPDPECRNSSFAGTLTIESTAVPEPGTLSLLALGGAALVAQRRRKRSVRKDPA